MEQPSSTHPYGPDAPKEDYLGLALGSLVCGVALGIGLNAVVALVVRTIQAGEPPAAGIDLGGAPAIVLLGGTFAACLMSAVATWRLMSPVANTYRQGMFGMVAFFASFAGALPARVADQAFGRAGLLGLAVLALTFCLWLRHRLTRPAR